MLQRQLGKKFWSKYSVKKFCAFCQLKICHKRRECHSDAAAATSQVLAPSQQKDQTENFYQSAGINNVHKYQQIKSDVVKTQTEPHQKLHKKSPRARYLQYIQNEPAQNLHPENEPQKNTNVKKEYMENILKNFQQTEQQQQQQQLQQKAPYLNGSSPGSQTDLLQKMVNKSVSKQENNDQIQIQNASTQNQEENPRLISNVQNMKQLNGQHFKIQDGHAIQQYQKMLNQNNVPNQLNNQQINNQLGNASMQNQEEISIQNVRPDLKQQLLQNFEKKLQDQSQESDPMQIFQKILNKTINNNNASTQSEQQTVPLHENIKQDQKEKLLKDFENKNKQEENFLVDPMEQFQKILNNAIPNFTSQISSGQKTQSVKNKLGAVQGQQPGLQNENLQKNNYLPKQQQRQQQNKISYSYMEPTQQLIYNQNQIDIDTHLSQINAQQEIEILNQKNQITLDSVKNSEINQEQIQVQQNQQKQQQQNLQNSASIDSEQEKSIFSPILPLPETGSDEFTDLLLKYNQISQKKIQQKNISDEINQQTINNNNNNSVQKPQIRKPKKLSERFSYAAEAAMKSQIDEQAPSIDEFYQMRQIQEQTEIQADQTNNLVDKPQIPEKHVQHAQHVHHAVRQEHVQHARDVRHAPIYQSSGFEPEFTIPNVQFYGLQEIQEQQLLQKSKNEEDKQKQKLNEEVLQKELQQQQQQQQQQQISVQNTEFLSQYTQVTDITPQQSEISKNDELISQPSQQKQTMDLFLDVDADLRAVHEATSEIFDQQPQQQQQQQQQQIIQQEQELQQQQQSFQNQNLQQQQNQQQQQLSSVESLYENLKSVHEGPSLVQLPPEMLENIKQIKIAQQMEQAVQHVQDLAHNVHVEEDQSSQEMVEEQESLKESKKVAILDKDMTPLELSEALKISIDQVNEVLEQLELDFDKMIELEICEFIASELCIDYEVVDRVALQKQKRPAVVTVMGHVDHGKTSLLDALRNTSVAASEAGGITQHIGAFEVALPGSEQNLTFLDTPGHAAFSAMRSRGALVTDLVVLVVASNESVMPQTKEAIAHARAAGCPIVVALTKVDLPACNPEKVKNQLMLEGLELEEVGGDVPVVMTSAKSGKGLQELSETLMLQADMMELQAPFSGFAEASVIEAKFLKGMGSVATVIVQKGELKVGDSIVVGMQHGKIRSLKGPGGKSLKSCKPGQAAEISGLRGLPQAGDRLQAVIDEDRATKLVRARQKQLERQSQSLSNLDPQQSDQKQQAIIPIVVKADVQGSVEALLNALSAFKNDFINLKVVHTGVGMVSESDVQLADACEGRVIGLNVQAADQNVQKLARKCQVTIATHRVIYHLLDEVAAWMEEQSPYESIEEVVGRAEVLATFPVKGKKKGEVLGKAAGCVVQEGIIDSSCFKVNVIREGSVIFEGKLSSLRHHKNDVEKVASGKECGIFVKEFKDFQLGDVLECIVEKRTKGFQRPATM